MACENSGDTQRCHIHEMFTSVNIQTLKNSEFPAIKIYRWVRKLRALRLASKQEVIEQSCDHSGTLCIFLIGNLVC